MCPCDLTRYYVCAGCSEAIEGLCRALLAAEERGLDSQRFYRGALDRHGLKASIVIYRIANGERQHA